MPYLLLAKLCTIDKAMKV